MTRAGPLLTLIPTPRLPRRVLAVVGFASVVMVASRIGMLSALLTRTPPSWWRTPIVDASIADRATTFENAAVSQLYLARPMDPASFSEDRTTSSEPWRVALDERDINAWLTARLPRWLEGQGDAVEWPAGISELQVRADEGVVRAGFRVDRPAGTRYVTASFRPELDDAGAFWLRASWIQVGRLPIPAAWVLGEDDDRGILPTQLIERPEVEVFLRMARGEAPFANDPVVRLEDNRRVRLLDVRVRRGKLELTMRTETRRPNQQPPD